ncbi:hypothetical protein [Streptomyces sp. TE33382]
MLPEIQPGVLMDGNDIGKWPQQQKQPGTWARLLPEQRERLTTLGVQPAEAPSPASKAGPTKGPSKAEQPVERSWCRWPACPGYR